MKKAKTFKTHEQGSCPVCGGDSLEYDGYEVEDNSLKYPWTCDKCGASGDEFYDISFSEHCNVTDKDGNEYTKKD
jgi:predicted nucleic-acid-binding Zn-ribbon protein